jgi:uncharacterized protein YqgC (DUF456 family)
MTADYARGIFDARRAGAEKTAKIPEKCGVIIHLKLVLCATRC